MTSRSLSNLFSFVTGCFRKESSGEPIALVSRPDKPLREYGRGGYYSLNAKDVIHDRYQAIFPLGFGRYATLWLAQDLQTHERVALKILIEGQEGAKEAGGWDELDMLTTLRDTNPQSLGYRYICHLHDSFVVEGPSGSHQCLVLEPMGASVRELAHSLSGRRRLVFTKRMTRHVLLALDYLHRECGIIHTDIKDDNILISGEPIPVGKEAVHIEAKEALAATFKLIDFGAANKMTRRLAQQIQPDALRSPEVILGAEWDTKTDIWNFGCIVYEVLRGSALFAPQWRNQETGMSPAETHLAQITALLGDFPPQLLAQGKRASQYFDPEGHLLKTDPTYDTSIPQLLDGLYSRRKIRQAADFLSKMLVIDTEQRWSAAQLLQHPWVKEQ